MTYNTPNEELTGIIIDRLLKDDLIREGSKEDVHEYLTSGQSKPEDWIHIAEKIVMQEDSHEKASATQRNNA